MLSGFEIFKFFVSDHLKLVNGKKRGTHIFKGVQSTVNLSFVLESLYGNIHLIKLRFSHL